jgi:amino acid transporter
MLPTSPDDRHARLAAPKRQLTLYDSTCIIVGIIIGAGIYVSSPTIAGLVPGMGWLLTAWVLGGLLSLVGALCYAELATAYPEAGGDYVYLNRAFGSWAGFLFAWSQLWVVRPGSIGVMAFAFAQYANQIWPQAPRDEASYVLLGYAVAPIVVLTAINILGVRQGKWTQNLLTTVKVLGLLAIILVGLLCTAPPKPAWQTVPAAPQAFSLRDFGMAMVFVLFTYGGWNEMAFVAAEVRHPTKNILRALLWGTLAVTAIYLLVTLAFLHALGFQDMRRPTLAADVLQLGLGDWAGRAISVLICISALGVINGQIFTGSRIYYAMGKDHRLYAWLGRWNPRLGTPVPSLLIQSLITLVLVVGFGSTASGFESMVKFTTPAFWFFLVLVGLAVFILRYREPQVPRPFRTTLYPITPILFCLSSAFMVYSSLDHAVTNRSWEAIWAVAILLLGVVMIFLNRPLPRSQEPAGR